MKLLTLATILLLAHTAFGFGPGTRIYDEYQEMLKNQPIQEPSFEALSMVPVGSCTGQGHSIVGYRAPFGMRYGVRYTGLFGTGEAFGRGSYGFINSAQVELAPGQVMSVLVEYSKANERYEAQLQFGESVVVQIPCD